MSHLLRQALSRLAHPDVSNASPSSPRTRFWPSLRVGRDDRQASHTCPTSIRLRREIEGFSSEFLLFVGAVREVKLRVLGADPFETSHCPRLLGNGDASRSSARTAAATSGSSRIGCTRRPRSSQDRSARPSHAPQVKVTVAVPKRQAQQRIGRFWSLLPAPGQTSASALFNAPWSVNDDRTTLLENDYNREILATLSENVRRPAPAGDGARRPRRPSGLHAGARKGRTLLRRRASYARTSPDCRRTLRWSLTAQVP